MLLIFSSDALLREVLGKVDRIMADLTALNVALDKLVATEESVVAELQRLSALVGEGGSVTQAELDAVTARIEGVSTEITNAMAQDPQ